MKKVSAVSIIIVNYNGRSLLEECLTSVFAQNYPSDGYEVIVVDNNSSDDSVLYILKHFPAVNVIASKENTGFTGGNNIGFEQATGEYIVLLNSDVVVDSNWLTSLVLSAQDPKVGIISSRLRFATPFVNLTIDSATVPKSKVFHTIDHSPIGALIENIVCTPSSLNNLVYYNQGFYDKKEGEICTRRTSGKASVLLPFDPTQLVNTYTVTLHGIDADEAMTIPVSLSINDKEKIQVMLKAHEATQVTITVDKSEVENEYVWLIQNAGNVVLASGYGKDRGSVILRRDNERREFYEQESPYFLKKAELLAACGASCLIKREVIDHVGFLDGNYFMYYEDVEFSVRAWRAGWKIIYDPNSIGYHKHRATTGTEESSFFLNLVERNHIAFVVTHFPLLSVIKELVYFVLRVAMTTLKCFVFQFKDDEIRARIWRQKYEGRRMAFFFVMRTFPRLFMVRSRMNRYWPMDTKRFIKKLY